jgi:hypothetical protein
MSSGATRNFSDAWRGCISFPSTSRPPSAPRSWAATRSLTSAGGASSQAL